GPSGSSGGGSADTSSGFSPSDITSGPSCGEDEIACEASCCPSTQVCFEGACADDCGGEPACGAAQACCTDGDTCYLGQCVTPAGACQDSGCATRVENSDCGDGFICAGDLGLCVPSMANPACEYVPPPAEFSPIPRFTWGSRATVACVDGSECQTAETCVADICSPTWTHRDPDVAPANYQVSSIPVVADLDADCTPEIIFNTYIDGTISTQGVIRAIRGDTGLPVWSVTDPAYQSNSTANPSVGDIDSDGLPEVVVAGLGSTLVAIESDGTPKWVSETFSSTNSSGSVAIANMDNAGDPELVFGAAIVDSSGALVWEGTAGIGRDGQGPISCIADLDGDGRPELIGGNTAYTTTGTVAGGDFAGSILWESSVADGRCGVADFNGDGAPEVILVRGGQVHALNGQTGVEIASFSIPGSEDRGGAPNIADFNGDGRPDVGTAGASFYVVTEFDGSAFAELWRAATEDDSSRVTGSSVFDFDGDGTNEVIYNDEFFIRIYPGVEPDCQLVPPGPGCDGIMTDEEVLFQDPNTSRTRTEYPVVADVDGDFKAELVFSNNSDVSWGLDGGIEVWEDQLDNWVATRPVWNQHSYHITNVEVDGTIPVTEPDAWDTPGFNAYRRNAQGASNFCAPDLALFDLRVEQTTCPTLDISVDVANLGCLGVGPGVAVSFYEQDAGLLGTVNTLAALPAGASETVSLATGESIPSATIFAVVDDDGTGMGVLNECDEMNDIEPLLVCTPVG
ncbi:MAG: VCBS repeat-containing protein, partial [Nannocystaceae bacterium]|nr:VCBS repeat-containing protein [Nannocystaceae bacterium]